jgi:hypothetical protein
MRGLVVGDPHAHPGYDNERFTALGNAITVWRPDWIHLTGDVGDFASLCAHSKQKDKENKRFKADLAAMVDALDRIDAPIAGYNLRRRAARRATYKPRKTVTLGNHDVRGFSMESEDPKLEGLFSGVVEAFTSRGYEVTNFKETVVIGGFACSHFMPSGQMGRPIGGKNIAQALLTECHQSVIVGHDHRFRTATSIRPDGTRIHAFDAGCYVHPGYVEDWCRNTRRGWDEGVLLLDGVANGEYSSYRWVTAAEILRKFGRKM